MEVTGRVSQRENETAEGGEEKMMRERQVVTCGVCGTWIVEGPTTPIERRWPCLRCGSLQRRLRPEREAIGGVPGSLTQQLLASIPDIRPVAAAVRGLYARHPGF